jgi:hypothetical protein
VILSYIVEQVSLSYEFGHTVFLQAAKIKRLIGLKLYGMRREFKFCLM